MRIVGFVQSHNNVVNGYLRRCLRSLRAICDEIVIYDDASFEDVWSLYREFGCIVVPGREQAFARELYHKEELLTWALRFRPDWICWTDTDACLGRAWSTRPAAESFLSQADAQGAHLVMLHNLNLWRSHWWYRTDEKFNDLWHGVFWRNTGELHYQPRTGLHQQQFPLFWHDGQRPTVSVRFDRPEGQLLHFGFAREEEIVRKYFTYRQAGQTGWALERLVDERKLCLESASSVWYPEWLLEEIGAPEGSPAPKLTPGSMARVPDFKTWRDFYASDELWDAGWPIRTSTQDGAGGADTSGGGGIDGSR